MANDYEERQKRLEGFFNNDFLPIAQNIESQYRVANALEYIAHHMGKISRNLERIAADYPPAKK